jgi:hypothetical protein
MGAHAPPIRQQLWREVGRLRDRLAVQHKHAQDRVARPGLRRGACSSCCPRLRNLAPNEVQEPQLELGGSE